MSSRVFRLWPSLAEELERQGEAVTVRGTATAAGRRPTRSPRRFAWKFEPGEETWFLGREVTSEMRVYRVLWRRSLDEHVGKRPLEMHRTVLRQLRAGATPADICATLHMVDEEGMFVALAREVHEVFHDGDPQPPAEADGAKGADGEQ